MKAILFFVAAGIVLDSHRQAAAAIAAKTGKKVVFRNGTSPDLTNEKPEANEGVAGKVPKAYADFPRYNDAGELESPGTAPAPGNPDNKPLNLLGLPEGSPDNREDLKRALEEMGVEFHPNAKTDKLADLFREAVEAKIAAEKIG